MVALLLGGLLLLGGCTRTIEHTWPDGSVTRYRNTGFDTSFENLEIRNGQTVIKVEKFSSESKAFEVAGKALDVAAAVAVAK